MPSSLFGFADERCETPVKLSTSARRGHELRGGREQRMSKGDPVSHNHNDVRVNRGLERSHTLIHDCIDQNGGRVARPPPRQ